LNQTDIKAAAASEMAAPSSLESWPASVNDFDWDSFLNHTMTSSSLPHQAERQDSGSEPPPFGSVGDTTLWTDMFLGDTNIDWIGLGDSLSV